MTPTGRTAQSSRYAKQMWDGSRHTLIRRLFLAASLLALSTVFPLSLVHSQDATGSIHGLVTDSASGEAVLYATVRVDGLRRGASTDLRGYFVLRSIPAGSHTVTVSCVGYRTRRLPVTVVHGTTTELHILLRAESIQLDEMLVQREAPVRATETDLGLERISVQQIEMVPPVLESDVLRALQIVPGVGSTSDMSTRYYVRGGGSDQNAILLNRATIYNPFHALGVFSVLDPEMISAVEFYKGGFPSDYGGRLSSFMNVVTRDGNKNSYHGSATVSMIAAKASVEGPIPHGSFMITGRKSYRPETLERYLHTAGTPFDFYDLSFKVNYSDPAFDRNGKLVLHGFLSSDRVIHDDPFQEDYHLKNNIVGLLWDKVWSSPLVSSASLSLSRFTAEVRPNLTQAKPRQNRVTDVTANVDFAYVYASNDELRFGLHNTVLSTSLALNNLYDKEFSFDQHGWDLNLYADYRFYRWETVGLHIGSRIKILSLSTIRPFLFEPRIGATFRPTPFLTLKAAAGWHSQEIVTLTDENELITIFEPWTIIPNYLAAPEASHYLLGIVADVTDRIRIEVEGYYKSLLDLTDINPAKYTARDRDFVSVDGESYGLESSVTWQERRVFLQASYALAWSYKLMSQGRLIPRYDARHSISVLLGVDFGEGWLADVVWTFRSGYPFTPVAGFYDRLDLDPRSPSAVDNPYDPVIFWGARNSQRLPAYHRLDVSMSKSFRIDPVEVGVGVSLVNVYDRKNILYLDRDTGTVYYMLRFAPAAWVSVRL